MPLRRTVLLWICECQFRPFDGTGLFHLRKVHLGAALSTRAKGPTLGLRSTQPTLSAKNVRFRGIASLNRLGDDWQAGPRNKVAEYVELILALLFLRLPY